MPRLALIIRELELIGARTDKNLRRHLEEKLSELGDEMGVLNSATASNSKDLTAVKAIQVHLQTEMDTFESKVGKVFQLIYCTT